MISIKAEDKGGNRDHVLVTGSQFQQIRQAGPVEAVATWQSWDLPMTGTDLLEDVRATFLTSNAHGLFWRAAVMGPRLIPSDAPEGRPAQPVAVLSYGFWQRHFHASRDVLGKILHLLHKNYTIMGILPPRFTWTGAQIPPSSETSATMACSVR